MASATLKLSRSEWRQVSTIAGQVDWARHGQDHAELATGLSDCAATALQQLLRLV